jgi:allophanate hydrolase subunit 2
MMRGAMVEVLHPGWLSIIVDNGRFGYADIGVPWSSALDGFAYGTLNLLLGNDPAAPAIEVLGNDFSLRFYEEASFAIAGARVNGLLDGEEITSWKSFRAKKGATLRVTKVMEGFRYYVGVSGMFDLPKVIGSFSTNVECRFGGYNGRPLMKGDVVAMKEGRLIDEREVPSGQLADLGPPHVLRWIEGPEAGYFRDESIKRLRHTDLHSSGDRGGTEEPTQAYSGVRRGERRSDNEGIHMKANWYKEDTSAGYTVSAKSNRTGIRLEGEPLHFRKKAPKSIVSEALLPGTIQVPGDGMPIISLYERMNGGYARLGVIARVDSDRLAHLKPGDRVHFQRITREEALELSRMRREAISALHRTLR